jgi:pimeloyl-ACP methyl ester carboxylesterase
MRARAGHDTWSRLHQLMMPVLIAGGRFDGIAPPDNLAAIASRIPHAQLTTFDGGHLFMIQDKTAYLAMMDWIAERIADWKIPTTHSSVAGVLFLQSSLGSASQPRRMTNLTV